jgi:hypothetical protein
MSTQTQHSLRIPQAFAFQAPAKSNSSCGRWVVRYSREHFTHTVSDIAYFWRKADAMAFYQANTIAALQP